jgi:MraZ protein
VEKWKKVWETVGAVFKGSHRLRIDQKGRLPVPAPFRRLLREGGALVLTLLDDCLAAYPSAEWERVADRLRQMPSFGKQARALSRLLASHACDCELDSQGRILIPASLRRAAGLESEAIVNGVLERFEIWAPDRWARFLGEAERLLDDASLDIPWPLPRSGSAVPDRVPAPGHPSTGKA